ncbi:MAG: class I tRNA ligase family protein, partial [Desulfobacterales bacterium]|nr:class I tRNA ligase family protein [Desulfobacterales bacterium]
WHEFCDWYLEMVKQNLYGDDEVLKRSSRVVLQKALIGVLKFLHPFMPFVTEEIWERLPGTKGSIMVAPFPESSEFPFDEQALTEMNLLMGVITGVRNIRGEMNVSPSQKVDIVIESPEKTEAEILRLHIPHIQNLARVSAVTVDALVAKPEGSATAVYGHNQIHVLLKGLLNFEEERKRLAKEINKIEKEMELAERKLSNRQFTEKAPAEIVEGVKEKVESMRLQLVKLHQNLNFFESVND